jgi:serpin B
MYLRRFSLPLAALLCLGFGCSCNKAKADDGQTQPVIPASLSQGNNGFAFRLYSLADKPGKNLFYSPYSISTAMSMVYGGAKGNTATQIAKALSFSSDQTAQHAAYKAIGTSLNAIGKEGKAELSVANSLFGAELYKDLLVPEYLELLRENYDSDYYSLDFGKAQATADFINRWVENKTKNRIKDLISKQHIEQSNDGAVLVNAIYFKGNWLTEFDPKYTYKDNFYVSSTKIGQDTARPAMFMHIKEEFPYAELPGCQVLELPYSEQDLAMLVVLPKDIEQLKNDLNLETLEKWQENLETGMVNVYLPKFKFDLTFDGLSDLLKEMGIKDAFDAELADLSGIRREDTGAGLYILDVVHKAFVEVNEEGTEAAAATGVIMATKAAPGPDPIPVFRADRPFLYLILHKPTNTILFLGKMNEPPKD